MSESKMDRRSALKIGTTAVVAAVAGGLVGYYAKPSTEVTVPGQTVTLTGGTATVTSTVTVAGTGQLAKGLKIDVISNAPAGGDPFWNVCYKGMVDASSLLGFESVMHYFGEDAAKGQEILDQVTATGTNAIILTDTQAGAFRQGVARAVEKGILVLTTFADDPESARHAYIGYGMSYYDQAVAMGKYLAPMIPKGAPVVIAQEQLGPNWADDRARGYTDAFKDLGVTTDVDILDAGYDYGKAEASITAYLVGHPETKAVLCVGSVCSDRVGEAIKKMGKKPGEIISSGFDLPAPGMQAIEEGYTQALFAAGQYFIFMDAIVEAYQVLKLKFGAYEIKTGYSIVDKSNVADFKDFVAQGYY